MKDPVKIMILGIAVMLISIYIQTHEKLSFYENSASAADLIIVIGFITTVVGFFMKVKE